MSKITRAIYDAKKSGSKIKASIRLKKNGQFSSISGEIKDLKVSRDGFPYITVKTTNTSKPFQSVRLDNVLTLNKDNKLYKK